RAYALANDTAVTSVPRRQKKGALSSRELGHSNRAGTLNAISPEVRSQPTWSQPLPASPAIDASQKREVGFILTGLNFKPIYTNVAAVSILNFPDPSHSTSAAGFAPRIR